MTVPWRSHFECNTIRRHASGYLRLDRGLGDARQPRSTRTSSSSRPRPTRAGLPRPSPRRAPGHAALDRRLAERAALGDLPAHAPPARRRAHFLPALVRPLPLLQRGLHARPDVAAAASSSASGAACRRSNRRIFGLQSIEESREKYRETLDVFFAACKHRRSTLRARHYEARAHVKPVQKPYPPLWFPSSNRESIEFTARHGYHTAFLGKLADCKPLFDRYRELWEQHRDDPGRHNAHVAAPFLAQDPAPGDRRDRRRGRSASGARPTTRGPATSIT